MNKEKLSHDPFKQQLDIEEKPAKEQKEYLNRTLTIRSDHLEKLRAKSYWDRKTQKDILEEALEEYFKGKNIKPIPGDKNG